VPKGYSPLLTAVRDSSIHRAIIILSVAFREESMSTLPFRLTLLGPSRPPGLYAIWELCNFAYNEWQGRSIGLRSNRFDPRMSALGHYQTFLNVRFLLNDVRFPKADILCVERNVR
jgi:hypothetical protein